MNYDDIIKENKDIDFEVFGITSLDNRGNVIVEMKDDNLKVTVELIKRKEDNIYILYKISTKEDGEEHSYNSNVLFESFDINEIVTFVKNYLKQNSFVTNIPTNNIRIELF